MTNDLLTTHFHTIRRQSVQACEPLAIEDYSLQAEAFTSPPKWHLAHTSWFFETFLLKPFADAYSVFHPAYEVLFNSYYNAIGEQFPRPRRGLLSRPTVAEVLAYRDHIDKAMVVLLEQKDHPQRTTIIQRCQLGIEHEKQHQELFYTDLKYSLSINPLYPEYISPEYISSEHTKPETKHDNTSKAIQWCNFEAGLVDIGANVDSNNRDHSNQSSAFTFDNETPKHKVHLTPFALANRLVTNAEFQAFIEDGGYQKPQYWLADGWAIVQQQQWSAPLYWLDKDGEALEYGLYGLQARTPHNPVCHISGYEADAYASWANARLPTETEWEHAASQQSCHLNEPHHFLQPQQAAGQVPLLQLYGDCWQWTGSAYRPYPGFKTAKGAIGEYNGKFMCNQWVLRGGSCFSSSQHVRPTYRNFFYPQDRWQVSGIRLAKNI